MWIYFGINTSFSLIVAQGLYTFLAHWDGMHSDRPCSLIHGRVCLGFSGCWSRLPDVDAGEAQHSGLAAKTNSPLVSRSRSSGSHLL